MASSSYSPHRPPATPPAGAIRPSVALVIPTLREAASLPALLGRLQATLAHAPFDCEILVVDDDSRDGTAELVTSIAREDSRIRLLIRRGERGLAGAVLHGWQNASADLLGVIDADLQHPPEMLPALVAAVLEGCDLAIASRYAGSAGLSWNPLRRFISAAAVCLARPLQRRSLRVTDPMSGYFLIRRRSIRNIAFQPAGFKLLLEVLVRGRISSVREIPIAFGRRSAGRSKANFRIAWEFLSLLTRLLAFRLASRPHSGRSSIRPEESSGD